MKKKLFSDLDVNVEQYNDFKIITDQEFEIVSNSNKTCIFANLASQSELLIKESGFYKIQYNHSNHKNMKISVAPNISVTILENNTAFEETSLNNVEFEIAENSELVLNVVDNFDAAYLNRYFAVSKNAKLDFNLITLAKSYLESRITVDLNDIFAAANFNLITHATDSAKLYFDVAVNNNSANTNANIWQKGVAQLGGQISLNASGFIKKGADKATNFQESRILLLDDAAFGEASPNLLIDHYNVEAGHAASVSRVNDEELYYLQTRGLDLHSAERLMTIAFIRPLLDGIVDENIQTELTALVFERLGLDAE